MFLKILNSEKKVTRHLLQTVSRQTRAMGSSNEADRVSMKRQFFFTQRIIRGWHSLPPDAVEPENLARFRKGLDTLLKERGIGSY